MIRLATNLDVKNLQDASGGEIKEGHVILDQATNLVLGQNGIYISDISTHPVISQIVFGGTIYIDSALSPLCYLNLNNSSNGHVGWTEKSDALNPIVIKPLHTDGKQLILSGNAKTTEVLYMADFNVLLDFETEEFPGHKWGAGPFPHKSMAVVVDRAFDPGREGIMTVRMEAAKDNTTKFMGIRGGYFEHGFARVRVGSTTDENIIDKLLFERMVIGPGEAEGFYIGMETGEYPKFKEVIIQDTYIAGSGAEAIQLAHVGEVYIRSVSIMCAGMKALSPFSLYQSNGIQLRGSGRIENVVLKGFGENGMIFLGEGKRLAKNSHVEGGMGIGAYLQGDSELNDIDFSHMSRTWWMTGLKQKTVMVDGKAKIVDCRSDVSVAGMTIKKIDQAEFVNSGLDDYLEVSSFTVSSFTTMIGKVYPNAGEFIFYDLDNVVRNPADGCWYKCIEAYTCDENSKTPDLDTVHWERLMWDSKGVRSDMEGFDVETASHRLPLDLRLRANTYDNIKGRGFSNEDNDKQTVVKWFVADNAKNTVNSHRLPAPNTLTIDKKRYSQIEKGKYLIAEITPVSEFGTGNIKQTSILL